MQGLPKRPARTADYPKERAQRRARSRVAAATICRRFPRRACDSRKLQPALPGLETAADQQRRQPRHQ